MLVVWLVFPSLFTVKPDEKGFFLWGMEGDKPCLFRTKSCQGMDIHFWLQQGRNNKRSNLRQGPSFHACIMSAHTCVKGRICITTLRHTLRHLALYPAYVEKDHLKGFITKEGFCLLWAFLLALNTGKLQPLLIKKIEFSGAVFEK